jgi:F420-non-reducing hydrogenase iron-sulfur subunit
MADNKTVITLICERAVDVNPICDGQGAVNEVPGLHVIKLPCSGMIQPLMVEHALKSGAAGVIVCGCQIGDCYYREGNKLIRERLLGERIPTLKRGTDRRRILALWLARPQTRQFVAEAKEFVVKVNGLPTPEPAKTAAPAAKSPAQAKAEATPAQKAAEAKAPEAQPVKAVEKKEDPATTPDPEQAKKEEAKAAVEGTSRALEETKVEAPKEEEKKAE